MIGASSCNATNPVSPTSIQTQRIDTTLPHDCLNNKIASRSGAPRPPMTDVGTETAFDQRKSISEKVNIS